MQVEPIHLKQINQQHHQLLELFPTRVLVNQMLGHLQINHFSQGLLGQLSFPPPLPPLLLETSPPFQIQDFPVSVQVSVQILVIRIYFLERFIMVIIPIYRSSLGKQEVNQQFGWVIQVQVVLLQWLGCLKLLLGLQNYQNCHHLFHLLILQAIPVQLLALLVHLVLLSLI